MTSQKSELAGVGVDIEEIARFKNKPFEENKAFYEKIFSEAEIGYCLGKHFPYQHFAARFCAKEAFIKASGKKLNPSDIEVLREENEPKLRVKGFKNLQAQVSLAHAKDYAIAFVILTKLGD